MRSSAPSRDKPQKTPLRGGGGSKVVLGRGLPRFAQIECTPPRPPALATAFVFAGERADCPGARLVPHTTTTPSQPRLSAPAALLEPPQTSSDRLLPSPQLTTLPPTSEDRPHAALRPHPLARRRCQVRVLFPFSSFTRPPPTPPIHPSAAVARCPSLLWSARAPHRRLS